MYLQPDSEELNGKVLGYLMGYLAILTGHRSVVFCNLTNKHIDEAEDFDNGNKYRILVSVFPTVYYLRPQFTSKFCQDTLQVE